jgi:hypothetical protein
MMSNLDLANCASNGPQSALERKFIEEYLQSKCYRLADLQMLPKEDVKRLMTEACKFTSFKLAEMESRAKFREKIHYV